MASLDGEMGWAHGLWHIVKPSLAASDELLINERGVSPKRRALYLSNLHEQAYLRKPGWRLKPEALSSLLADKQILTALR